MVFVLPGFGQRSQNEDPPPLEGTSQSHSTLCMTRRIKNVQGSKLKRLCEEVFKELRVTEEKASNLQQATTKQSKSLNCSKYMCINNVESHTASHFYDVHVYISTCKVGESTEHPSSKG